MIARLPAAVALGCALIAAAGPDVPRRDLAADQRRGGHTLARHVGQTDAQLRQRLRDQPAISAASTYPDLDTAEQVVGRILEQQAARVRSWSRRRGSRPNLVLRGADPRGPPIGRVLARGRRTPMPARGAVVVLRWAPGTGSFYVLTSYPEIRQ